MTPGASLSSLAAGIAEGRELVQGFGQWWLSEFLHLFPLPMADWLVDTGGRTLVLAPATDAVVLRLMTERGRLLASRRIGRSDYAPDRIDAFLRSHRQSRAEVAIALSLPEELIFRRNFALPLQTRREIDAVVVQDLLAKTPFQLANIHHAHRVRRAGDRLVVAQCVVRRDHVAAAAESLGLAPEEIDFIEPPDAGHADAGPAIYTGPSAALGRNRWMRRLNLGLAATALLLAVAAVGVRYHRQQVVLDELQGKVAAATAQAKTVLAAVERREREQAILRRLRARRDEAGVMDIWEEATRLLPAHTWLTELRLSEASGERQVVMTGFSAAAASLVGVLDQSAVFGDAALVGPIAVDPTEGRERFIIQAKLKPAAQSRTASR